MNLEQLIRLLRISIGETGTSDGLWSDSELQDLLNRGQIAVARDISTRNHPWAQFMHAEVPCVSGAEYYLLPWNVMRIRQVSHEQKGQKKQKLVKANIQQASMNSFIDNYGYRYLYYEVVGKAAPYIAKGVASTTADEILTDPHGDFSRVRRGDIVHNITDNSMAIVDGFQSGLLSVTDWRGGSSQRFEAGDDYRVQQAERLQKQLWVYPILDFNSQDVFSGLPDSIVLSADVAVDTLRFQVMNLPEDWEDDNNVAIYITDNSDDPSLIGPFSGYKIRQGWNEIKAGRFEMLQGLTYQLEARINNVDHELLTIDKIELQYLSDNYLKLNYMPEPAYLEYAHSLTELPVEAHDALIAYGKWRSLEKRDATGAMAQVAKAEYYEQVRNYIDYKQMESPDENDTWGGEQPDWFSDEPTPGFTNNYGILR